MKKQFLKNEFGMQLLGRTPEGTCPECATKHEPELPHNAQSLFYQYKFFDDTGRWPNWNDAMAHCSEEMKLQWIHLLEQQGVDLSAGRINPEQKKDK